MRTFFSTTLAFALLLVGLLSMAPRSASAQVEDVSDLVTQENLNSLLEDHTARSLDEEWSVVTEEAAADMSHRIRTYAHEDHNCPVQSFVGFGEDAQKRLDAFLTEHRDQKGAAVQTIDHDYATEFLFTAKSDTIGRAGRWNALAEAQWVDVSASGCDASTAASIQLVGEDLLTFMATHLKVPVHQFLTTLLPDSANGETRSDVETGGGPSTPEAPTVKARYGASMEIVAAYGDAAKQAGQLSQRGRRGYPPVKAVSHDGRTFYVAGEDQSRVISYFTGPVVFSIKMQQKEMPSGEPAEPGASRRPEESLLKTVTRTLDLDNREPIQPPSGLYDEASVRAFWKSTSIYGPEGKGRLLYEENALDLLPSDAPDSFSYRFAGLGGKMGGTSIGIALPLDWTTISPSRRGVGGIAFARSAEDFDTETVTISSSPISLKADDNVIIQASVPGRRGSGPGPGSMIEDLLGQAPLKEATVAQEPADTTLSGYDAVRATVQGMDADGRPARYRMFGISAEGTTLMLAVLRPEAVSAETKEIIQTALNHLDVREI